MKIQKKPVKVVFEEIQARFSFSSKVMKNNDTSGKINAPKAWIDQEVIVILKPKEVKK
jgi:putative transposon-encoded protein